MTCTFDACSLPFVGWALCICQKWQSSLSLRVAKANTATWSLSEILLALRIYLDMHQITFMPYKGMFNIHPGLHISLWREWGYGLDFENSKPSHLVCDGFLWVSALVLLYFVTSTVERKREDHCSPNDMFDQWAVWEFGQVFCLVTPLSATMFCPFLEAWVPDRRMYHQKVGPLYVFCVLYSTSKNLYRYWYHQRQWFDAICVDKVANY